MSLLKKSSEGEFFLRSIIAVHAASAVAPSRECYKSREGSRRWLVGSFLRRLFDWPITERVVAFLAGSLDGRWRSSLHRVCVYVFVVPAASNLAAVLVVRDARRGVSGSTRNLIIACGIMPDTKSCTPPCRLTGIPTRSR